MTTASKKAKPSSSGPGPLVSVDWLAANVARPDLRLVHVSTVRRVYNKHHIAGATYSDLHKELALRGTAPETGEAVREWLVPTREQVEAILRRWRVGTGDRVVIYDDIGLNRHAIRGYWLLRLYGFPKDRVHILDGGIEAWRRADQPTTTDIPEADLADGLRAPVELGERDEFAGRDVRRGPGLESRVERRRRCTDPHPRRPNGRRVCRRRPSSEAWRPHPGCTPALLRRPADRRRHVPAGR